jgi:hypothetical protein
MATLAAKEFLKKTLYITTSDMGGKFRVLGAFQNGTKMAL